MEWSSQQKDALRKFDYWFRNESNRKKLFTMAGFAGTGKTTIAKHFASMIDGDVLFAAFTGKAANVLRTKGCEGARTIHSLIYRYQEDNNGVGKFVLNRDSSLKNAKLLILDECSMVNEKIAKDLLSFKTPICVLGDPGQLPPIEGLDWFFQKKPDVFLTEIHRQALENPIIALSKRIREQQKISIGIYGDSVIKKNVTIEELLSTDQIIVGRNETRKSLNSMIRKKLNFISIYPEKKDRLICLKNHKDYEIYNGQIFQVLSNPVIEEKKKQIRMSIEDDDNNIYSLFAHTSDFNIEHSRPQKLDAKFATFDFAYAITAHKSQGSQWNNIVIFDESWCFREYSSRWLYTAITRAAKKMTLIVS
jgi:exodeoxyribonuclease-5